MKSQLDEIQKQLDRIEQAIACESDPERLDYLTGVQAELTEHERFLLEDDIRRYPLNMERVRRYARFISCLLL